MDTRTMDQIESVDEVTQESISEQIREGYTSGHLEQNGNRVYWEITINIF